MKQKNMICLLSGIILGLLVGFALFAREAGARISESRKEVLETITEVCADNWDRYHGYASTCAMMAGNESSFGKACPNYNLWGIKGGHYYSLKDGVLGWLEVINNQYFPNAREKKSGDAQLDYLLDRGYCVPRGRYFSNCMWLKARYDLGELDDTMFELIQEKKEHQRFKAKYDSSIPVNAVGVDKDIIGSGTVRIGLRYFDVIPVKGLGNHILFGKVDDVRSRLKPFKVEFFKEAVG